MPGFRHKTVFGLCLALFVLTGTAIVCVSLLLLERQDISLLQQHIASLRQENGASRDG